MAAHERGHTATRAQETSRWWLHRHSCTDEGWAGQCLMFREILTSATSPSRARGTASGCTCYGMDPASCLLSLYRHAPFLTSHALVGYLSNLAASHHHLTNPQGRVCTRPPGSCKHGLAGNSLRSLAARFTRKPTATHMRDNRHQFNMGLLGAYPQTQYQTYSASLHPQIGKPP